MRLAVVSCAFTAPSLSHRILRGNDVSYGIYIFHAVVLNVFIHLGFQGRVDGVLATLGITAILAVLSWRLVERPALKLKRGALKRV